jgi:thymidylate synthase (FAD)
MASYSQESTRYCNYSNDKFDKEITVIDPEFGDNAEAFELWKKSCEESEKAYFALLDAGCTPQYARAVLPTSLKTELVMTANIREWRHFLKLRSDAASHPQIRKVAGILIDKFHDNIPVLFDDISV